MDNSEYDEGKITLYWESKRNNVKRRRQDDSIECRNSNDYLLKETFDIWKVLAQNVQDMQQTTSAERSKVFENKETGREKNSVKEKAFIFWKSIPQHHKESADKRIT